MQTQPLDQTACRRSRCQHARHDHQHLVLGWNAGGKVQAEHGRDAGGLGYHAVNDSGYRFRSGPGHQGQRQPMWPVPVDHMVQGSAGQCQRSHGTKQQHQQVKAQAPSGVDVQLKTLALASRRVVRRQAVKQSALPRPDQVVRSSALAVGVCSAEFGAAHHRLSHRQFSLPSGLG